jgi:EmrB/QacA subfamily drug resistance transporter
MHDVPRTTSPGWVLALASAGSLMVALDQLVVANALTTIRVDLGASEAALEWTVNAFNLSFAVFLLAGAALGDRFGRRRMFLAGLIGFTVASAACALAPGIGALIACRFLQGLGAALIMPLAIALLNAAYPAARRGRAQGVFAALTGLAVVAGPVFGGVVTEGLDWRWIFWLNVPIGAVVVPLAATRIAESRGRRARLDVTGLVLLGLGWSGVVWALVRGNPAGWASPEVLAAAVAGVVGIAAFVGWELRTPEPMLPMRLFTVRAFAAGNAVAFLLTASLFGMVFMLSQYLQAGLGHSPLGAGLRTLPWTVLLFVAAPLSGRLTDRIGPRPLIVAGLAVQAAGFAWIALVAAERWGYPALVPGLVVAGLGVSVAMPPGQHAVVQSVSEDLIGKASGSYSMLRQLGGVFGIAVLAATFGARGGYGSAAEFGSGAAPAFAVAAALSLLGSLAGLGVSRRRPAASAPVPAQEAVVAAH